MKIGHSGFQSAAAGRLAVTGLLAVLLIAMPQVAQPKGGGAGGGSSASAGSEDEDFDDDQVLDTAKPGKRPSHFALKASARFGLRHAFDHAFTLEAFIRDQQGALDNPFSLRSSVATGGLDTAYKFGATTWMVTFQTGEAFTGFYEHTTRTNYTLHTTLQQQIKLGESAASVVPRVQVGYQWSSDPKLQRWKFQVTAPVDYQLTDTVILMPLMPKLSYQPYTSRPDNRVDWTLNISTGIRWFIAPSSFLQAAIGFENRWSNVTSAAFSRWVLAPQVNLRVAF